MTAATRTYRSARRAEQARQTRRAVLAAAADAFQAGGYAGTTMRAVAAAAGVSLPTVEVLFGTKAVLLKAAIDVAIAGDDEPVPVLDRDWTLRARAAVSGAEVLELTATVISEAQRRSAGLILALFEGARTAPELIELSKQKITQRRITARWIVDTVCARTPLRAELSADDATDTLWLLMDPAVFDRLTHELHWPLERYSSWFAGSARHLLIPDPPAARRPA